MSMSYPVLQKERRFESIFQTAEYNSFVIISCCDCFVIIVLYYGDNETMKEVIHMESWMVETRDLKKYYRLGENTLKALDGVSLRVREREFVAIIGKSGSGKSTLLHMLGGLDVPSAGEISVDGKSILGMSREERTIFRRRKVGFVFQSYNLVPDLNVYENIVLPIELDGRRIDREFVDEIMHLLQLNDRREALPAMLSGGQQQRVAIARALAAKPKLVRRRADGQP